MTATGPASVQTLQAVLGDPILGALVDISAYVLFTEAASVTQGRSGQYDDAQPGSFVVTLDNTDGRFTPDNPLSPYYPWVVEGQDVKWSVTPPGGASSIRFRGRLAVIEPDIVDGQTAKSAVRWTCVDVFGRLSRRVFGPEFIERWKASARANEADVFPFNQTTLRPTTFKNAGSTTGTAKIVPARSRTGSATMTAPDGIVLDSCVQLSAVNGFGPVVQISVGARPALDIVIPFRTADRIAAGKAARYIAQGLDAAGGEEWSLRMVDNAGATDLRFYDSSGSSALVYGGFAPVGEGEQGDDQWYVLRVLNDGVDEVFDLYRVADDYYFFSSSSAGYEVGRTYSIILGGNMSSKAPGKQQNCITGQWGAIAIDAEDFPGHTSYLTANATESSTARIADLTSYSESAATIVGTDPDLVTLAPLSGRSAFEVAAELARTTGGLLAKDYSDGDAWTYIASSALRSSTVSLTLDALEDLDASGGLPWRRGIDTRPTRVTASWPSGSVTVIGNETFQQVDGSVETCAADADGARSVASSMVNGSGALTLEQLTVDLVHAQNDLWATMFALTVGDRVRVESLPSDIYGREYVDLYVLGWTETYAQASAVWVLDTVAADDPPAGAFDDDDYGRFAARAGSMTVTSGTAVGTTSTGTIVVTSTAETFTTSAGAYPVNLDWNGETVTVTSAPASSTSPQTLTLTARGVGASVARSHSAGEAIQVALAAAFTF